MIFQRVIGTTRLQKDVGLCDLQALLYNPTNLLYLGETLLVLLWLYCVCYGFTVSAMALFWSTDASDCQNYCQTNNFSLGKIRKKNESLNLLLQAPILPSDTKRNVKNECQRRGNKKEKPYFIILWSTGQIF